jgi:hypothetical protein
MVTLELRVRTFCEPFFWVWAELADSGVSLLQLKSVRGKQRVWFEGLPNFPAPFTALGYGVVVTNRQRSAASITVTGRGFTDE